MNPKYKRVLLKLSGGALAGESGFGIDEDIILDICQQIKKAQEMGIEIGIVVGGGNFWRGRQGVEMDRSTADHMGMLATVINCLALQDALERIGVVTRVQTALDITKVAEPFIQRRALRHLEKKRVVIFGCGTGNPYFTTDTAAALRANEINAEILLLAKNVDAVYDCDPECNSNAKKYDKITHFDFIKKDLSAMDTSAVALCHENTMPILVFGLKEKNSILNAITGINVGTLITT